MDEQRRGAGRRAGWWLGLGMVVMLLPLGGCGIFTVSSEVETVQAQVADLQRRQQTLINQIELLQSVQEEHLRLLREARADQSVQFDHIGQRLDALEQMLRHSTQELDRVSRGMGAVTALGAGAAAGTRSAAPDTVEIPVVEGEKLYDAAYANLLQGRYPLAIMEFREYLQRFPRGDLADDSQYWIGESYYAQSELQTAAQAFQTLVDRYPDSVRVPAALLKAGFCYVDLSEEDRARNYFRRVIDEYPYSDAAIKARDRLERLDRR
jgi:tol-pal system protein YbgF